MLYTKILEDIKKNKAIKEGKGNLGIPVPFPRLSEHLPLIEKGLSIGLLGATGSGKSPLARYLFLYAPYKFYKETGYKVKVFFYCLEDNISKVYHHCLCNYLHLEHNIIVTPKELTSKVVALPQFVIDKLDEAVEYFRDFEKIVEFVGDKYTPKDIYKVLERHALKTGKVRNRIRVTEEGIDIPETYYESDLHTIVVFDNMSNLDTDSEDDADSERKAMVKLARDYARKRLVNFFHFTVVQILQLDFQSERQQYTHSGMTIVSKLEPSLAGIGDAKTISRSMHVVLGLFDPSRYDLIHYPIPSKHDPENCYRIDILGDRFRAIKVLKNNDGKAGIRIGLMFDPISETFTEMPKPKTPEIQNIYSSLTKKDGKNLAISEIHTNFVVEDEETPF